MITLDAWALVRQSLPAAVAREVEESQPADLREAVALVEPHLDSGRAWWLWRDALSAWAREQTNARDVLRALTLLDRRLGVWCACAVARTALRYVPEGEHRPRVAIETAGRWVRGAATVEECRRAASEAWDYWRAAYAAAAACAAAAAYAASAASAASGAAAADDAYAAAAAHAAAVWRATRDRRLRDLCHVAADAVLSMPWEVTQ